MFTGYGVCSLRQRWKLLRKLSNLHMLGGKALDGWAQVREKEMGYMLGSMYDCSKKGEVVVVAEMLTYVMANMIGEVILSRRVFETKDSESNQFKDMVVELMTFAGYFNIGDFVPFLAWLDLQGIEREMKTLHKKFDLLLTRMIKEHVSSRSYNGKGKQDFLDILMDHCSKSNDGERLTLTNVKALLLVLPFISPHLICVYILFIVLNIKEKSDSKFFCHKTL